MTSVESILVVHKDSPNLSGGLDLSAWKPEAEQYLKLMNDNKWALVKEFLPPDTSIDYVSTAEVILP